jgi:hypothetical protein
MAHNRLVSVHTLLFEQMSQILDIRKRKAVQMRSDENYTSVLVTREL